jgi:hypothetical protein
MANMELITSVTVGSGGAASVTLPATGTIPQTYTDLYLVISARSNRSNVADGFLIKPNNTSPTVRYITGDGATTYSGTDYSGILPAANATASTFGSCSAYFPNYANTSNNKSFSVDDVSENNGTTAYATLSANLYSSTSAITTIVVQSINAASIVEGSTFYLYGVSNANVGAQATGGVIYTDGSYFYHTFTSTGVFTPTTTLSCDYLIVGGGGGGGWYTGGGGGAGGLVYQTAQTLTATGYTATIGAGGSGAPGGQNNIGANGSDSSFNSKTATGGGRGGVWGFTYPVGADGGSGGGGAENSGAQSGGASNQNSYSGTGFGNAGGSSFGGSPYCGGGGGGAGQVGYTGTAAGGGAGGNGKQYVEFSNATGTGVSGYYAGGGGAANGINGGGNQGGLGGGGTGTLTTGEAGRVNTGGGGGAGSTSSSTGGAGGAGGSGLVIVRYAI